MTTCDLVRENLEAALAGELDASLTGHLHECADCQETLRRARQTEEGGAVLQSIRAPSSLKQRLKSMARLPQACEEAVERLGLALDGELDGAGQRALLDHLHACRGCQATWEAFATLREIGALTKAPARFAAALAVHPDHRIDVRKRRRFDLRLATAAAYLLAALTVFLIGNPAQIARASNVPIERATVYTRAVVENRFESFTRHLREGAVSTLGWAGDKAQDVWDATRRLIQRRPANQKPSGSVVPDGNGGRS